VRALHQFFTRRGEDRLRRAARTNPMTLTFAFIVVIVLLLAVLVAVSRNR
jgi:hypothetical protein